MRRATCLAAVWVVIATGAGAAEVSVGPSNSFDLGGASLQLGCANLTVAGTFSAGNVGFDAAGHVSIDPGGTLNGNTA